MTYADPAQRQELITGLRALADFLASHPEVPAPPYTDVLVFPPPGSGPARRREIDLIASRIGSGTEISPIYRHYQTSCRFGPVEYRVVAIPRGRDKEQ